MDQIENISASSLDEQLIEIGTEPPQLSQPKVEAKPLSNDHFCTKCRQISNSFLSSSPFPNRRPHHEISSSPIRPISYRDDEALLNIDGDVSGLKAFCLKYNLFDF